MDKDYFYNKYDEELTKINKELPKLDELSSSYSKQAYVLMLYAHFEGFVYRISRDFFNVLLNIHKTMSDCIKVVLRQYKEDLYEILENEKYLL